MIGPLSDLLYAHAILHGSTHTRAQLVRRERARDLIDEKSRLRRQRRRAERMAGEQNLPRRPPIPNCVCGHLWAHHSSGGDHCAMCRCGEYRRPQGSRHSNRLTMNKGDRP